MNDQLKRYEHEFDPARQYEKRMTEAFDQAAALHALALLRLDIEYGDDFDFDDEPEEEGHA